MIRAISSDTGSCYQLLTITLADTVNAGRERERECLLSALRTWIPSRDGAPSGESGTCRWIEHESSAGFGGSTPDVPGCSGVDPIKLVANHEHFNDSGRIDVVTFDAESGCDQFLTAARDSDADIQKYFSAEESCAIFGSYLFYSVSGDCEGITHWAGRGVGGVKSVAEAQAVAAMNQPHQAGASEIWGEALISACQRLPPVSLTAAASSFNAGGVLLR